MGLSWMQARARVVAEVEALGPVEAESVALDDAAGRVLAADVAADRDQPPFDRSTRDGFAVRAADVAGPPATLRVLGDVAAGRRFDGALGPGESVAIMTGAPVPPGADAVVMVEHTAGWQARGARWAEVARGPGATVVVERAIRPGDNVVPRGSELGAGQVALAAGARLDHAALALLASLGCARPAVRRRPVVAVLPTGDELVPVEVAPGPAQIRDSNRYSLAAQIARAGGTALVLPTAADEVAALRASIARGLAEADILVLSGGVSMGEHDLVEGVLAELGARVVFDAVDVRPGKPTVFALCRGRPVFGLPGNPLSTMVTFELFARPAIALRGGGRPTPVTLARATLAAPLRQRPVPLTVFLPARWRGEGAEAQVDIVTSQGSGDLAAAAKADLWVVLPPGTGDLPAGAPVALMAK